jgi:hypothetical protein
MYIVSVPPLADIAEVSFTHAVAEVALGTHELVQDSSHALRVVTQAESAQKRMFPRSDASYEEYVEGFHVTFCWKGFGVADPWLFVRVIGT